MLKKDIVIGGVIVAQCALLGIVTLTRRNQPVIDNAPAPIAVPVTAQFVMGPEPDFLGDPKSSWTLVEFGDYDCPPCAMMDAQVKALLKSYPGALKVVFRNFPLEGMHPRALNAALHAEVARQRGHFWPVHDALYALQGDVQPAKLQQISADNGVEGIVFRSGAKGALQAVRRDQKDALTLKVEGTPTFFLCNSKGKVQKLGALSQVERLMASG